MRTWLFCRHKKEFGEKRVLFFQDTSEGKTNQSTDIKTPLDPEQAQKDTETENKPQAQSPEVSQAKGTGEESAERVDTGFSGFDLKDEELTDETFNQRQKNASEQVLEMYHRVFSSEELEQYTFLPHSPKELVTRKIDELNKHYRSFGENLWKRTIDRIRVTNERAIQQLKVLSEREIRAGEILQELKERKVRVSAKSKKLQALASQIGISRPLLKIAAGFNGAREGINATLRRRSTEEKANGVFYGRLVNRAEKDVTAIRTEASAEAKRLHAMLEKRFKDDTAKREGIIDYLLPENTPSEQKEAKKRELQEMITAYVTKPDIYAEDQNNENEKQKKREEMQKMIDGIQDVGDRRMVEILLKSMQPRLAGIRKTPTAAKYHETIRDIHQTAQDIELNKKEYTARGKLRKFFEKNSLVQGRKVTIIFLQKQKGIQNEWKIESASENEYHLENTHDTSIKIKIAKDVKGEWRIFTKDNLKSTTAEKEITVRLIDISLPSII